MSPHILNTASSIVCPHGGQVQLFSTNSRVLADNSPTLLETDTHPVLGCPFLAGSKYSPCVRVEWTAGAAGATVQGTPVLTRSSIGFCMNAEGATQGTALIVNSQMKDTVR